MCVSIPGRVLAIEGNLAEIDVLGARRRVGTLVLPEVQIGDYVLTSAGLIVEILDEEDAQASIALFQALMDLDSDEEGAP